MIINTDKGGFGSFADLRHYMQDEGLEEIKITGVNYWGIRLPHGTYTVKEIDQILTGEGLDEPEDER